MKTVITTKLIPTGWWDARGRYAKAKYNKPTTSQQQANNKPVSQNSVRNGDDITNKSIELWNLLWICPISAWVGFAIAAVLAVGGRKE